MNATEIVEACSFENCTRPARAMRLCGVHYRNADGEKRCGRCQEWKPESAFGKNRGKADGLNGTCRACISDLRHRRHGITKEQFDSILAAQGGACAICHDKSPGNWHMDHDHSCCPPARFTSRHSCGQCIRGILCENCNRGLGMFADDPIRIQRAVSYLAQGRLVPR